MDTEVTYLTIDQIRAASHDTSLISVSSDLCALLGLTYDNDDAKPRFVAWMTAKGWRPVGEAAGNVHWSRDNGDSIWLDDLVECSAEIIIRATTGNLEIRHGRVSEFDDRDQIDILAEILATEPDAKAKEDAERLTGGGLLIVSDDGTMTTTSWGE